MNKRKALVTVLDHLCLSRAESARVCIERAWLCSRLAKLVGGGLRAKLYRMKNQNIRAAIAGGSAKLEITFDNDRHIGLLSIGIRGANEFRVHSHESWIAAA